MNFAGAGATIAGWAMSLAGAERTGAAAIYFVGTGATIAGWAIILAGAAMILADEWRDTTALNPFTASAVWKWKDGHF